MAFNPQELIIERAKEVLFTDYSTENPLVRITEVEDSTLECTSENDEVTDAQGTPIDRIPRSKAATFSASGSFFNLGLAALQFGAEKELASAENKFVVPYFEVLKADADAHTMTLSKTPVEGTVKVCPIADKSIGEAMELAPSAPEQGQFSVSGTTVTLNEADTGSFYVTYKFEAESGARVVNRADKFPETVGFRALVICKNVCNPNLKYLAIVEAKRAQLDATSIAIAFSFDGKHPFTVNFNKEYCEEDADLFTIYVIED